MPAQALIRCLQKAEVDQRIKQLGDALTATQQSDGSILIACKANAEGNGSAAGAADALQAICDLDAAEVRKRVDKAKAEAEEKRKAELEAKRKSEGG